MFHTHLLGRSDLKCDPPVSNCASCVVPGAARKEAMRGALQAQAAAARAEAARLRAQYWDTLAVPACDIAGLRTAAMVRCKPRELSPTEWAATQSLELQCLSDAHEHTAAVPSPALACTVHDAPPMPRQCRK